jgi:hypothetical protein
VVDWEIGLFRIRKPVVRLKQYVVGYAIPTGINNRYAESIEIPIPPNSIIAGVTIAFNTDVGAGEVKTVKLEFITDDGEVFSREFSSTFSDVKGDKLDLDDAYLYLLMGGWIDDNTLHPVGAVEARNIVLIRAWAKSSMGQTFESEIYIRYYTVG